MLKIIEKDRRKVAVLTLTGNPLGEEDANLIREKILSVVGAEVKHVVFDMNGVQHINSAGLGGLVAALHTMSRSEGTVQFLGVKGNVERIFKITRLAEIFDIRQSLDEILQA